MINFFTMSPIDKTLAYGDHNFHKHGWRKLSGKDNIADFLGSNQIQHLTIMYGKNVYGIRSDLLTGNFNICYNNSKISTTRVGIVLDGRESFLTFENLRQKDLDDLLRL